MPFAEHLIRPAVDHWQGRHPWPLTLVVSVIGMTYLFDWLLMQLPEMPSSLGIALWVVGGCALLTWQVVGTAKAARANLTPPSDSFAAWGGYATILVAVILVGLKMLDGVSRHIPPSVAEVDLDSGRQQTMVRIVEGDLVIEGGLDYATNTALADALKRNPNTRRVVFDSTGGHVFAARAIANQILSLRLDTHVEDRCFSACTIAFMAGNNRTLGAGGQLGFHRYSFANRFRVQTVDPVAEQEKDRSYFLTRGVRPDFLDRVFNAENSDLWRPDHATLRAASVTTAEPDEQ
ncbi:MAG: hypothetical protein ACR2PA_06230 [Hyphomicrobiaceae bacterium]